MAEAVRVAEQVRKEAEKTIEPLKGIGDGRGKSVDELKDKLLD